MSKPFFNPVLIISFVTEKYFCQQKVIVCLYLQNDGGSQKPNYISTSNQHDICSANVQDLQSLEFSLSDIIDSIGDNCNSKSSEDSESLQQICDLESINNSNQQDSHENINELNYIDNQMDQTDDKTELEKCLEMIKYLSR